MTDTDKQTEEDRLDKVVKATTAAGYREWEAFLALDALRAPEKVADAVDSWCFHHSQSNEGYRYLLHKVSGQLRARAYDNVRASGDGP